MILIISILVMMHTFSSRESKDLRAFRREKVGTGGQLARSLYSSPPGKRPEPNMLAIATPRIRHARSILFCIHHIRLVLAKRSMLE